MTEGQRSDDRIQKARSDDRSPRRAPPLAASAQSDRKRNSFKRKLDRINRIIGIERPSAERAPRRRRKKSTSIL